MLGLLQRDDLARSRRDGQHRVIAFKAAHDLRASVYSPEVINSLLSILLNHTVALQETS